MSQTELYCRAHFTSLSDSVVWVSVDQFTFILASNRFLQAENAVLLGSRVGREDASYQCRDFPVILLFSDLYFQQLLLEICSYFMVRLPFFRTVSFYADHDDQ